MQTAMDRVAKAQEQLTTGRVINRPSDDPAGATTAMRIRSSLADQKQYVRNADDAVGWLNQIDGTLSTMTDQVRRARDIALQGANSGSMGPDAREALATEIDQIRAGLVSSSNTQYLDRPVFGGLTAGSDAFTLADPADPSSAVVYTGVPSSTGVVRTVAAGAKVRVDVEGPDVFGTAPDSVFDHLDGTRRRAAVRRCGGHERRRSPGSTPTASGSPTCRPTSVRARSGSSARSSVASDSQLSLTSALSDVENTDLAKATVDLGLQEVAYQAALGATSRVLQPSLLDFLR